MSFPISTKVCEMINAYFLRTGFDENNYTLLYNAQKIYSKDERKNSEILKDLSNISVFSNNMSQGGFFFK